MKEADIDTITGLVFLVTYTVFIIGIYIENERELRKRVRERKKRGKTNV